MSKRKTTKRKQRKKVYNFKTQLRVGQRGEDFFLECYPGSKKTSGRIDDITFSDGKSLELKTDSWELNKTPNFFMELIGNNNTGKLGGPWRALDDNIDYFVYLFIADKTFFWFETAKLVKFLDKWSKGKKLRKVFNKGYHSEGYLVPRTALKKVMMKEEKF